MIFTDYKRRRQLLNNYTAKYIKIKSGYMGQSIEWPEVITEGNIMSEILKRAGISTEGRYLIHHSFRYTYNNILRNYI